MLTILHHPDGRRVGQFWAAEPNSAQSVELSREAPLFQGGAGPEWALGDSYVSRKSASIVVTGGGLDIFTPEQAGITIPGQSLRTEYAFSEEAAGRGIPLVLNERIVVLVHRRPPHSAPPKDDLGILGASPQIAALREAIARHATTAHPALVRGESGTGKELVARALHRLGRPRGPFVAESVAPIQEGPWKSTLFGHEQGAFTDARSTHRGLFEQADRGVLFLDEIAEARPDLQAGLLRVVEQKEIRRQGSTRAVAVDVRLVTATDQPLDTRVADGRFREQLYQRLAAVELHTPPLRHRREDIGRLLYHFLALELGEDADRRLWPLQRRGLTWLPAGFVADLACAPWAGNVRALKTVAYRLASWGRRLERLPEGPEWDAILKFANRRVRTRPNKAEVSAPQPASPVRAEELSDEAVDQALLQAGGVAALAARRLGIPRSTLLSLMKRRPDFAGADQLTQEAIADAIENQGARLSIVAAHFGLRPSAVLRRMKRLRMPLG